MCDTLFLFKKWQSGLIQEEGLGPLCRQEPQVFILDTTPRQTSEKSSGNYLEQPEIPATDFLSSVKLKPTLDFSCIHLPVWNIIWKWSIHLSICQRVPFSQVTMILINNMNVAPLILRVDITLSDYPRALGLCSCNLKSGLHCLISPTKRRKREHPCGIMAYTPTVFTLILWAPFSLMNTLSEGWRAGLGGWEEQSTMR